jgi:hypothetical protein
MHIHAQPQACASANWPSHSHSWAPHYIMAQRPQQSTEYLYSLCSRYVRNSSVGMEHEQSQYKIATSSWWVAGWWYGPGWWVVHGKVALVSGDMSLVRSCWAVVGSDWTWLMGRIQDSFSHGPARKWKNGPAWW